MQKRAQFNYVYRYDTQVHTHTHTHKRCTHIHILLIKKQIKKIIPVGKSKYIFSFHVQNKYPFPNAVHIF